LSAYVGRTSLSKLFAKLGCFIAHTPLVLTGGAVLASTSPPETLQHVTRDVGDWIA
jgi:hypothetical protein